MDVVAQIRKQPIKISLPDAVVPGQPFALKVDGEELTATWLKTAGLLVLADPDGVEHHVRLRGHAVTRFEGEAETTVAGDFFAGGKIHYLRGTLRPDVPGQDARGRSAAGSELRLRSQITGKILKVLVKAGDRVESGQPLVIIEAMKMENRVFTQTAGTVASVAVKDGDAIQTGKELLRITP